MSLVAAACGSGDPDTTASPTLATDAPAAEPEEATSDDADPASETEPDDGATSEDGEDSAAEAPPSEHLFPDIDVVDIPTGDTVNLAAQLAGGDTPVLLWFWAPH